jgi:Protein of unknown function (DUF3352)
VRVEQGNGRGPRLVVMAVAAAIVLALAGCGSKALTGTNADPAGVVPASAPVYVGAVVRPSGSLKREALAGGHALTHQRNPYIRLLGILQTPGSPALDFGRDVAPWLGENAGLFLTSLGSSEVLTNLLRQGLTGSGTVSWPFGSVSAGGGGQGAIVLDTGDLAKARSFVAKQAAYAGAHPSSFDGVSYQAGSGAAFAVIDKLVVLGSEAGVRAVIATSRGATSLSADATYVQLQSHAPTGALWHVYANPASAQGHGGGSGAQSPTGLLEALSGDRPLNLSLVPSAKSLALDADLGPAPAGASGAEGLLTALAGGNRALGELPGESWLAAGLSNVGGGLDGGVGGLKQLLSLVSTLSASGAGPSPLAPSSGQATLSIKGLLEGFLTPLKLLGANTAQARHDYLSWMGEAGMFAAGTTVLELKAAAVIDSKDAAASRAAVGKLASALNRSGAEATPAMIPGTEAAIEAKITGLPVTLVIADGRAADGQTKFVMGLAATSIQAALNPPSAMSGASSYSTAQTALGEGIQPSLVANFGTLLTLLEGVGLSEDSTISPLVPYLRNSSGVSGGGKSLGGGVQRLRLVLGLQPVKG